MHYGMPQGSVLRPLWFIIYVNYLVDNVESILFSGDTGIYGHDTNIVNLYVSMTQEHVKLTD